MPPAVPDDGPRVPSSGRPVRGRARDKHSRVFPARLEAFAAVRCFIEDICGAASFGRDDCAKLVLLIEELFTNTVMHGHGGDSDASVRLDLEVRDGEIALAYEDTAPPHDPFGARRSPAAGSVEDRPVGGLGVILVTNMAERVQYSYTDGRNRICVLMTRSR
jgi:serine/threonine-protein kinase RsbW